MLDEKVIEAWWNALTVTFCALAEENAERMRLTADGPGLLTCEGAAEYLAVSEPTIRAMRDAGELKAVEVAGRWKYPREELDKYIRRLVRGKAR